MTKVFSEDNALELAEKLLQNDKDIKEKLEQKIADISVGGDTVAEYVLVVTCDIERDRNANLSSASNMSETFDTINSAYLNGRDVILKAKDDGNEIIFTLYGISSDMICFTCFTMAVGSDVGIEVRHMIKYEAIIISSDDSIVCRAISNILTPYVELDILNAQEDITNLQSDVDELNDLVNNKADPSTTLSGYGITDTYTKTETDDVIATSKTEAISESKAYSDELKEELEGDFQEINDSVIEVKEEVLNLEEKFRITETTDTVLEDSYPGLLKVNEIGGKMEQFTNTGKNLFGLDDGDYFEADNRDVTVTVNNDIITVTANEDFIWPSMCKIFNVVAGKKYTISLESTTNKAHINVMETAEKPMAVLYPEITDEEIESIKQELGNDFLIDRNSITIEAISDEMLIIFSCSDYIYTGDSFSFTKLMFNEGETALPWEPYTGNQSSPNPSYPQEIKCVKGKNLLDCSELTEQTICGITFTPVFDDSDNLQCIKLKGTHDGTGSCTYILKSYNSKFDDNYIFNGVRNGSESSYFVEISGRKADGTAWWLKNLNGDTKFEPDTDHIYDIYICVIAGTTVDTEIYPMLRKTSASDPTYVPYGLLRIKTHWKNFHKTNLGSEYKNGLWYRAYEDGTISIIGTPTTDTDFPIITSDNFAGETGKYILNGCPSGGSSSTYCLYIYDGNEYIADEGSGSASFQLNKGDSYSTFIRIIESTDTLNLVFKPMIREVSIEDDTYEPYRESSYTLSQPVKLYGREDVQDVITPDGIERKYYATKVTALDVFDDTTIAGCVYLPNNIATFTVADNAYHNAMSNMFADIKPFNELYDDKSMQGLSIFTTMNAGGNQNLDFRITSIDQTLDAYNTFLATTPLEVVLERATPIFEPLPIVDQIGLNNLLTYNGVTYIEFDCDEVQPTFKGEYGKSKETGYILESLLNTRTNKLNQELINNRIAALEATIVNNI